MARRWTLLLMLCMAVSMTHAAQDQIDQQLLSIPASSNRVDFTSHSKSQALNFQLKHIFHRGAYKYPELHRRFDVVDGTRLTAVNVPGQNSHYLVKQAPITIERLVERPSFTSYRSFNDHTGSTDTSLWEAKDVAGPNVTDRETILSFARMALDAYVQEPDTGNWQDVGMGFNYTDHFGWENDGIRGHVFADRTNNTVVIAMKGTSLPFVDPIGTITNDKINDNLMFSCCCGQGGRWLWHQVCNCQTETKTCNSTCLAEEIREKTRYYYAAQELYFNVSMIYPDADIWLTGHSLGGSIASLIGLFVGQPVVTFEAPAEAMAAARLGLPQRHGLELGAEAYKHASTGGFHFGHTADDIYMGNCNAWNSICTIGGYAMETKCHTGHECVYDTVKDKGWSPNARYYHSIAVVLKDVYEEYDDLPECKVRTECTDCDDWVFTSKSRETSRDNFA